MNNKAKTSVKSTCVIIFLVSLIFLWKNWSNFRIATGRIRDVVSENCKSYSEGMRVHTSFPSVVGSLGQRTEYKTTTYRSGRRRRRKTTSYIVEYYAVPVYKDSFGEYHFAAVKCKTDTEKNNALKAYVGYVLYANKGVDISDGPDYYFEGGTFKMDADIKAAMVNALQKSGIANQYSGDLEDYIIPIVFEAVNEDSAALMGMLSIIGMVASAAVFVGSHIHSVNKAKEQELFNVPVQQSMYSDADDFFENVGMRDMGSQTANTSEPDLNSDFDSDNADETFDDNDSTKNNNFFSDDDNPFKHFGSTDDILLDAPSTYGSEYESPYNTDNAYNAFGFSDTNSTTLEASNASEDVENSYDESLEEFEDMYLGEMNMDIAGAFGSMEDNSTDGLK